MATAQNPTISKAARKRAHDRIHDYQKRLVAAGERYRSGLTLGDGSERSAGQDLMALRYQETGYIEALHDLLPTQVVDSIVGDQDEGVADDGGADAATAS